MKFGFKNVPADAPVTTLLNLASPKSNKALTGGSIYHDCHEQSAFSILLLSCLNFLGLVPRIQPGNEEKESVFPPVASVCQGIDANYAEW
jgi:hypothetical protein